MFDFYRATSYRDKRRFPSKIANFRVSVSAVFAVARCLSIRMSVTLVYCIHTAEDIVKRFVQPRSPIILVFHPQRRYPIPRGTPSAGAQNTRG